MRQIQVYHVDAFTTQPFNGNTAGVVLGADLLTESEMQAIAREVNQSETAFIMSTTHPEADYRVRYFTPTEEINFCGHATVGSSWVLATKLAEVKQAGKLTFETNIGLIPVEIAQENGQLSLVTMTQIAPQIKEIARDAREFARVTGISQDDIDDRYPIQLANTGNWHLLVPVKKRAAIDTATPAFSELADLNRQLQVSTTHLFTFDTQDDRYDLYTRDFAPAIGIEEDPVTGAANGALSGYLALNGFIPTDSIQQLTIAQGHAIGKPGELFIRVLPTVEGPKIQVAGAATITIEGTLIVR